MEKTITIDELELLPVINALEMRINAIENRIDTDKELTYISYVSLRNESMRLTKIKKELYKTYMED